MTKDKIPKSLRSLEWREADQGREFTDGETLLCAVGVGECEFEFAVVDVRVDPDYLGFDCDGEVWSFDWDTVSFYVQIRD